MSTEESDPELSTSTRFSESPETSGEAVPADQPDGLEEDLAQSEEDAGGSEQLTGNDEAHVGGPGEGADAEFPGIDLDSYTRGAWMGSEVTQAEIDWLYRPRRTPEEVFCRIPGPELKPAPRPGEYIVFSAHFERGLGLPVSDFFRDFLNFYELQPHHLPGNSVFYLSSFAAFMEGYVGITPTIDKFSYFYNLRKNSIQDTTLPHPKPFVRCGGCILAPRQGSIFYKLAGLESVRTWQKSFFYIRNGGPEDFINLPEYVPGPPAMTNWLHNPKDHKESKRVADFVELLQEGTKLSSADIVRLFLSRRVLPLQRRAHKMSQMSGQRDPTRMTTFSLSPEDLILKAKQICRNTLRPDGKYDNFPRIAREELPRYAPKRQFRDDADPDPYVKGPHPMGPTHVKRPGIFSTQSPAVDLDTDDEVVVLEVLEHVAPLAAEVGQEFLDTLAQRDQAPKGRKNKAPAEDAGPSAAPAAKRQRRVAPALMDGSAGKKCQPPPGKSPTLQPFRAPLKLTRSAPGMPPESSEDPERASPPPPTSPTSSGADKAPSLREGKTNSGCTAPKSPDHRAEDFTSPPEHEDTGASNMGAGTEAAGRSEPPVPPVQITKKKKKIASSPSKPLPEDPAPAAPSPAKEAPAPPPAKDASAPPPGPPAGKAASTPPASSPAGTIITAQQLTAVVTAATAPPSGSQGQSLILHAGRATVSAGEKASAQLGRIVEVTRGEVDLGSLRDYVEKWNRADLSPATRGLGKDKLPIVDEFDPRSTPQHLSRLKRVVKEFDTAWHDASANVVGTLDARKQLFEGLLWEYRDLREAFITLEQAHSQCSAALPETSLEELTSQISALKGEALPLEHSNALEAHRTNFGELKQKLIKSEVQHGEELKKTEAAGEAKVKEARKELIEATGKLQKELEAKAQALKAAEDRNAALLADQAEFDRLVAQADNQALNAALRVACSWYDDLDLDALHNMRADAPTNTDPVKAAKRRDRAYRIAHFVSTSTFIPPPADTADEISNEEENAEEDEANRRNVRGKTPGRAIDEEQQAPGRLARSKGRLRSSRLELGPACLRSRLALSLSRPGYGRLRCGWAGFYKPYPTGI
ncbi:hypothetical protein QYE76_031576 [Lolium multiflorum]|uniref:Transposase (putative) gypsy type domain-containing protein n=1 Tax=Lolium multiflorum TaxID=4521 RepID=A0AAD8QVL4_LOLMU|nr:hypothetical protein QYE76_031576 [Lolium multiflorum]